MIGTSLVAQTVKASAYNAGDPGLNPGLGRSPGEGNGSPLQYSCLENPMDGGAWWAAVHGVTKSWTRLSDFTFFLSFFLSHMVSRMYHLLHRKIKLFLPSHLPFPLSFSKHPHHKDQNKGPCSLFVYTFLIKEKCSQN